MQMDNVYPALRPYMQSDPKKAVAGIPGHTPDWSSNADRGAKPLRGSATDHSRKCLSCKKKWQGLPERRRHPPLWASTRCWCRKQGYPVYERAQATTASGRLLPGPGATASPLPQVLTRAEAGKHLPPSYGLTTTNRYCSRALQSLPDLPKGGERDSGTTEAPPSRTRASPSPGLVLWRHRGVALQLHVHPEHVGAESLLRPGSS